MGPCEVPLAAIRAPRGGPAIVVDGAEPPEDPGRGEDERLLARAAVVALVELEFLAGESVVLDLQADRRHAGSMPGTVNRPRRISRERLRPGVPGDIHAIRAREPRFRPATSAARSLIRRPSGLSSRRSGGRGSGSPGAHRDRRLETGRVGVTTPSPARRPATTAMTNNCSTQDEDVLRTSRPSFPSASAVVEPSRAKRKLVFAERRGRVAAFLAITSTRAPGDPATVWDRRPRPETGTLPYPSARPRARRTA